MPSSPPAPPPRPYAPLAGFLSYLVPGLGQIYQGRIGKGILFLVCLYTLFFTGMALGGWQNVYLPNGAKYPLGDQADGFGNRDPWENNSLHLSPPLAWVSNLLNRPHFAGQFWIGVAAWPAVWQYHNLPVPGEETSPFWHNFERAPEDEAKVNAFITAGDKSPDLGWVYTVIAGVLNILVIYDAFAGPAFGVGTDTPRPAKEAVPA